MNAPTNPEAILSAVVDRMATIKAQIAALKDEENSLRDALIDAGLPTVDGTLHRAAVSHCAGKTSIDWQSIAKHFKPSRQLITAHTSTGEPYYTVKLSAKPAERRNRGQMALDGV
jgi:hypothetical protein